MKNWNSHGKGREKSEEAPIHRRNIAAELEAPVAPCGIVDGRGATMASTTPGLREPVAYGKPAAPRADLELEATCKTTN